MPIPNPRLICTGAPPYLIFIVRLLQQFNFILFTQICQAFTRKLVTHCGHPDN